MSINASSFSAGYTGSVIVANTNAKVGQFRGFVVNSDCVVTACLDQASASLMTSLGLTGVTIRQGGYICVPDGSFISSITLSSGTVILYNV
jgi:hypothetical protein